MRISDTSVRVGLVMVALAVSGTGGAIAQQVVPTTPVQVQPSVIVQPGQPQRPAVVQPIRVRPASVRIYSVPVPLQPGSIPYQFEKEFYSFDGTAFQNRTLLRQLAYIFGPFPENEITRDGREVDQLYRETLARQLSNGPFLRTVDLPSPFNQTVGTLPEPEANIQPLPIQPPIIEREPAVISPSTTIEPAPDSPVPALW